jgi:hypothetical protein
MNGKEPTDRERQAEREAATARSRGGADTGQREGRTWADEAAKARTADDPRARTPKDAAGQPSTRSFEE